MIPRAALWWLALLCAALWLSACTHKSLSTLTLDDRVGRVVHAPEPPQLNGSIVTKPGDLVLESNGLRVVVGGANRPRPERGAVLELRLRSAGADQSLSRWSVGLTLDQRELRLRFDRVSLIDRAGQPVARIELSGRRDGRDIHVDRELTLSATEGVLGVATAVWTDEGKAIEDARVVEHLDWEGATPFAPGLGEITDENEHAVAWVARDGRRSAVLLGYVNEVMQVRRTLERHGDQRLPGTMQASSPKLRVTPKTATRVQSFVTLAHYGVSDALRHYGWARGKPFAEARVYVPDPPAGTMVRVYDPSGAVIVRGRPGPDGQLQMPLPDTTANAPLTNTAVANAPLTNTAVANAPLTIAATAWGHAATTPQAIRAGQEITLQIPRGGSVHVVVRDHAGDKISARVRFESLDNPKQPIELGPDHNAGGARDTVITLDGDMESPLLPGRYLVRVSRGPEYDLYEKTIQVTESFQPQVSARLTRVIDPGDWIGADFHLHSAPSPDSQVTLEDRVAALVAEGVRFAAPTDHDHISTLQRAIDTLGLQDFGTVSGIEITTQEPSIGHFNAYPMTPDPTRSGNGAMDTRGLTAEQIFTQLRAITPRPLIQVNHPRLEGGIGYFDAYAFDPATGQANPGFSESYDTLEVWNGFDLARPAAFERVFREWLTILQRGKRIVATGNSDSHLIRYQWSGYPRTWIRAAGGPRDANGVIAALRAGHAFVSDGPFLEATIDEHGPGELAHAEDGKVRLRVLVRAAPWIEVTTLECWVGDSLVHSEPITIGVSKNKRAKPSKPRPVLRMRKEIELPIARDAFVVVRVSGTQPMNDYFARNDIPPIAFTNPIFVDADGDGSTPWTASTATPTAAAPASATTP